jgi:hypothetical protein
MSALARLGGRKSPGLGKLPSKERESLRQYLRDVVEPSEVWTALKAALESGSQTAVVSAARLLVTELVEEHKDVDRAKEMESAAAGARLKLDEQLPRVVKACLMRLLADQPPQSPDPSIVRRTLELFRADPEHQPFLERLRAERSTEDELEARVAERIDALEREREELKAQRAEFAST